VINTLHTVTASPKGLGQDSPLTQQIAKRADANGDGTVSSAEFSLFMQELLARLDAPAEPKSASPSSGAPVTMDPKPGQAVPLVGAVSLGSLMRVEK
jgi:hypothetical protein